MLGSRRALDRVSYRPTILMLKLIAMTVEVKLISGERIKDSRMVKPLAKTIIRSVIEANLDLIAVGALSEVGLLIS